VDRRAALESAGEPCAFFDEALGQLIAHVRHHVARRATIDGSPAAAHHAKLALHGDATARAALADTGPSCPDALRYLLEWLYALHGRSGLGMNGLAPLSWPTIAAWSQMTGHRPNAREVVALFQLDDAMMSTTPGAP
jgi:hypothetical protein